MVNKKQNKELWSFWLTKTESKQMQDCLEDDNKEKAIELFLKSFKEGLVEKR